MEQVYEDGRPASAIDRIEVAQDDRPDTDDGKYYLLVSSTGNLTRILAEDNAEEETPSIDVPVAMWVSPPVTCQTNLIIQ
jgi:hypothetical protein